MTSCFVYSDLAHKLAGVCGNVFKLLAKNDERSPVRDGVTSGVASSVATERARVSRHRRAAAHGGLHALQHAFPGQLNDLCACAWVPCPCSRKVKTDADPACCARLEAHRALSDKENKERAGDKRRFGSRGASRPPRRTPSPTRGLRFPSSAGSSRWS